MQKTEALASAVKREISIGEFLMEKYKATEIGFEKKYKLTTKEFVKKFEDGKMGDGEELFEWLAAAKAVSHWEGKLKTLKECQ